MPATSRASTASVDAGLPTASIGPTAGPGTAAWRAAAARTPPPATNRLLAALSPEDRSTLEPMLERVRLASGDVLLRRGEPMTHAWFLDDAVAVLDLATEAGEAPAEVATIGSEGLVGLPLILGQDLSAYTGVVRIAGGAARIEAAALRQAVRDIPALRPLLDRYVHARMVQLAHAARCNRSHSVSQRLATLLLEVRDCTGGDRLPLTHEALSVMLGVRRASVTEAAVRLREAGAVGYWRGEVAVKDRALLMGVACACYATVRAAFDQVALPLA